MHRIPLFLLLCALVAAFAAPVAIAGNQVAITPGNAVSPTGAEQVQAAAKKKKKKKPSCKNRNSYKISKRKIFSKSAYRCMRQVIQAAQENDLLLKELQRLISSCRSAPIGS